MTRIVIEVAKQSASATNYVICSLQGFSVDRFRLYPVIVARDRARRSIFWTKHHTSSKAVVTHHTVRTHYLAFSLRKDTANEKEATIRCLVISYLASPSCGEAAWSRSKRQRSRHRRTVSWSASSINRVEYLVVSDRRAAERVGRGLVATVADVAFFLTTLGRAGQLPSNAPDRP